MIDAYLRLSQRQLARCLSQAHPIDPDALNDSQYFGVSLGLPGIVDRLAWKTFMKCFHLDPETGLLRGWNVRLQQTGLEGPATPMLRRNKPFSFAHFLVTEGQAGPWGAEHGLLLDYGQGGNAWYDPTRLLRDPLLALERGSARWLIGASWLALPGWNAPTPSFFVARRLGPLDHVATP